MQAQKLEIEGSAYGWLDKTLSSMEFFSNLTVGQLEVVLAAINLYSYPKGASIFRQGEPGDAMYIVYQGAVGITKKEGFFSKKSFRLGPGQIFGEMALLDAAPRTATASTLEPSKVFVFLKMDLDYIMAKNPELAGHMERLSAKRKFEMGQK